MMSSVPDTNRHDTNRQDTDRHLAELKQWLAIASVSSDPRHIDDMHRAMVWVADKFAAAGLRVQQIDTDGHPMVYAETATERSGGEDADAIPTVLIYGHYDVQPPEPLEDWITGPFEPTVRDGNLYARGATDDKGQVLTHVQAVCDLVAAGDLPDVRVKFLIEGEEEVGSANLERLLPELADQLACDCLIISDSSQYADGQPAITYGLRGIATYELTVTGPSQDLHSGSFGGAVMNPAIALCQMLGSMVDGNGRIALEGFYDSVADVAEQEIAAWAALPSDDERFAREIGVDELFGESGYTTDARRWARPTFDINGLTSGHQGEGVKTIIPAVASAKFSFRLVPGQDPNEVETAVRKHLQSRLPPGVRMELHADHAAPAMLARRDSPWTAAAADAIESAFGRRPVFIREGGSIPIVAEFQKVLGCDCLLLGWGLSDDNCHSPNEKFRIADYHRGIAASTELLRRIGQGIAAGGP